MYVKLENNTPVKWPVDASEIRLANSDQSLPEYITNEVALKFGYASFVFNGYPVEYDPEFQTIEEVAPVLKNGQYHQSYKITEKYTAEEKKTLQDNKAKEDNKQFAMSILRDTDWTQAVDVNLANKTEFAEYRAQVRAIAQNPPVTVEQWPVKPQEVWSS